MTVKITINDRLFDHDPPCITYEEVVALAGYAGNEYLVKYSSKRDGVVRREGTLNVGTTVLITDVMSFRVSHAGNA